MDLSVTSLQWSETDRLVMLESTGDLPPLTITWTTKCAPTCSPGSTTLWTKQPISVGQRLEKPYTISDTPTTTYDYLDVTYELDIDAPNADQLTPPISWDSEVRRDDKLSMEESGSPAPAAAPRRTAGPAAPMNRTAAGKRNHAITTPCDEKTRNNPREDFMVTPLKNRAPDEQGCAAPLRYSTAWDTADAPIAEARAAVRTLLAQAGHDPGRRPSQDAQLIVSELVTNALRHAPGPGSLALEVAPDAALLRITVRDSSPHPPELRAHDARRVGKHGLHLVTQLCDRVHTIARETGKQVVAHFHLRRLAD
ncbi:ATP-binding protein [Streptomyces sp. NPDC057433]|uniref:ATP-binding protein n=1 Tax=Streptomyces sp. NPDC057433 TaxID=3346132 RepID=UPI0036BCE03B